MSDATPRKPNRRVTLLLVAVVAVLPLAAAYGLYFFWRPSAFTNYGELLAPTSLADAVASQADGTRYDFARLRGKWVLLMVDSGACDAFCEGKLYRMRQVRLTQGQNMERIERAWLIDDDASPSARLAAEYPGTQQIRVKGSAVLQRLPAQTSTRAHIYVLDPLGNVILRYTGDADATGMKKDITRLLKVSRIG
jgi:cytochrome oxidase Cu insertion factor (SCO1/SenC/PrrC family)